MTFLKSQQEPRLLASYSKDKNMLDAYMNKRDLYATVASKVYNNDYWDNMEHREDGSQNPEGKKRRGFCKSIVLGIMYGRGAASIAEQISIDRVEKGEEPVTKEEAQSIIDKFFSGFPRVKIWMDNTIEMAKKVGYVEDLWGRQRRLPDIFLPKYDVLLEKQTENLFNPLLGSKGVINSEQDKLIKKYKEKLSKCRSKREFEFIKNEALKDHIVLIDNSGRKSQAERQAVNARVQGGAATMSKRAMIAVDNDEELNRLGFKLLIAVHDELIGECPEENAQQAADRLTKIMIEAGKPECECPMKCDAIIEKSWYQSDYEDSIKSEYNKYLKSNMTKEDALQELIENHSESLKSELEKIIND